MTNSYKIVFSSASSSGLARTFEISPESCARLIEGGLSGFDCTGFDVRISPYASCVGGYPSRRRFGERVLELTFELVGGGEKSDAARHTLVSMMNPGNDCSLEVNLYGVSRRIGVIPYDEAVFTRGGLSDSIEATLSFIAPAVFFEDSLSVTRIFRDCSPMLTFPMNFISGAGMVAGMYRTTDSAEIDNPGDGECGIIATIKASGGNVVNPGIKLGEEYILCQTVLSDSQTLVIDTRTHHKSIFLDGERYSSFDKGSTFFSLPAGQSTVTVTCQSGGEFIDAQIEYTPLYFGM